MNAWKCVLKSLKVSVAVHWFLSPILSAGGSVLTCVCAHVSVGLCASRRSSAMRGVDSREVKTRDHVETEITCRRVNKINNIRLFILFNKRTSYRPDWKSTRLNSSHTCISY